MSEKVKSEYLGYGMVFWFGVVEDRQDPIKLGRVRVRIYGWHDEKKDLVPTSSLPWAQVIQQPNSAANGDIGHSPTGILEGTWVVGFFVDGEKAQQPIVMGTLAGIPTSGPDPSKGFNDPNGVYPKLVNQPDVNRLARNDPEFPHPVPLLKELDRTRGVIVPGGDAWDEPESTYAAKYPYNHVHETESGHIREYDDTKGAERIHEYHKAGTFYEIDKEGNKVTRIVGNQYEIVAKDNFVNVKGNVNLTIDSNCNTFIKGNVKTRVLGDYEIDVLGKVKIDGLTINLNRGTRGAARIGDIDNDTELNGPDAIVTGSSTVFIGD